MPNFPQAGALLERVSDLLVEACGVSAAKPLPFEPLDTARRVITEVMKAIAPGFESSWARFAFYNALVTERRPRPESVETSPDRFLVVCQATGAPDGPVQFVTVSDEDALRVYWEQVHDPFAWVLTEVFDLDTGLELTFKVGLRCPLVTASTPTDQTAPFNTAAA